MKTWTKEATLLLEHIIGRKTDRKVKFLIKCYRNPRYELAEAKPRK